MAAPRRPAVILAGLGTALLIAVSGYALWRHTVGPVGDSPAVRSSVTEKVDKIVATTQQHADLCTEWLMKMTQSEKIAPESFSTQMDALETCGEAARGYAETGYQLLDQATDDAARTGGNVSTPGRDAYLDAAGALLSQHELQGDDFDLVFDRLEKALRNGTSLPSLANDVASTVGNSAPDIENVRQEYDRALAAYRKGG